MSGRVLRQMTGGDPEPAAGARIAIYSEGRQIAEKTTGERGDFRFEDVPEGRVSLQAADFRISRTPVFTDLLLAAGETLEVELLLSESLARTVSGSVQFHDPITNSLIPIEGAVAFIEGPGNFAYTDAAGNYRLDGVPVQGLNDGQYAVSVIDYDRQLEGQVQLPPILDTSPDEIIAQTIVLREMRGGVDGVVLDPLGRPYGGAQVLLFPYAEVTTRGDGTFSFDDIPVGGWELVAHVDDGLEPGRVGYFGEAEARIVFAGHRPFATIRMRGSGLVTIHTRTADSTGVLTPLFYRPTYYSQRAKQLQKRGAFIETSTDPAGHKQIEIPVGDFELVA